jgi:diguanylate cyclase (GGDEF)-like protein/PAS domain S-box-containing protein
MNQLQLSDFGHSDLPIPKAVDGPILVIDCIPYGVLIADNKMLISYANHGFSEMTGFSASEIIGRTCSFVQSESTDKQTRDAIRSACKNGTTFHGEILNFKKDGTAFWNELSIEPMRNSAGQVQGFIGISRDITQRKNFEEQIKQLAFYDTLTGLANRTLFYDRLNLAMLASNRSGHCGAIICIDLDQFKPVNDDYGHAAGDAMLTEVATRLKHCVRGSDTVARFGGDEFVVMLSELSAVNSESLAQAIQVAEKLRAALSADYSLTVKHNGMPDEIIRHISTASIGVSIFQGNQLDADQILKSADKAMYRAKKQGGGLVCIHEENCE